MQETNSTTHTPKQGEPHRQSPPDYRPLIIVLFVLGIFSVVVMVLFVRQFPPNLPAAEAVTQLAVIRMALEHYHGENARFPNASEGLQVLYTPRKGGPYIDIQTPPCGDACGTALVPGFEVWENEAYLLDATAGSEYTIDFCAGYDPMTWPAGRWVSESCTIWPWLCRRWVCYSGPGARYRRFLCGPGSQQQ